MKNIIIGGTHGLGQEIAKNLQANGEKTFVVGRSYGPEEHGEGTRADLASPSEARALAAKIEDLGDKAINFYWVSGYGFNGDFTEQDAPERMAAVNFGNVLPVAQAAFKRMLRLEQVSHFVVVSSTTGVKARTDEAVYAGTKHAQVGFTRSLGIEAERLESSVRVALFMPGGMQTPFWKGNRPTAYDEFLEPSKVAARITEVVRKQQDNFYEEEIPRGSL